MCTVGEARDERAHGGRPDELGLDARVLGAEPDGERAEREDAPVVLAQQREIEAHLSRYGRGTSGVGGVPTVHNDVRT